MSSFNLHQRGFSPILLIAGVALLIFLLVTSVAPFRNKMLSSLFPKQFSFAAGSAIINPSLGAPTNLQLTGLDSTIRANWTAPTDPNTAWQVFSVWDGNKLVGTKILSKSANVADGNGLESSHQFTIKVQSMNAAGELSNPLQANATTDPQSPIRDAAFFDNFNDAAHGDLNSDYYDVRTWSGYGDTDNLPDAKRGIVSERHYHTQVIESQGQGGIMIRPRVPATLVNADGSPRTLTFEFEIDLPPVQAAHGKWFELHFTQDPPNSHEAFGSSEQNVAYPNNVRFAIERQTDFSEDYNIANIQVNVNGNNKRFVGTKAHFTPVNVRVPIVIKLSPTSSEMFVNGVSAVKASGFTLPWTSGYWTLMDVNYRSAYDGSHETFPQGPTITNQLTHWDMIQYDGPSGSYNPIVKTYLQPGCDGFVYMLYQETPNCPTFTYGSGSKNVNVTLTIPTGDDLSKVRSARLLFNGPLPHGMNIMMNGNSLVNLPIKQDTEDTIRQLNSYALTPSQIAQLKNGANVFNFQTSGVLNYVGTSQLELEVVYNQPRTLTNPPQGFVPMINVTTNNFRYDHMVGGANVVTGTTYLYNFGSDQPINYTISQISPAANPWFTITSPLTGTISPVPTGGNLVPINFSIDFSKFTQPSVDHDSGRPAVIKITGGMMSAYVAVLAVKDQITKPINYLTFTNNEIIFNKAAIPDYHLTTTPPPSIAPSPSAPVSPSASVNPPASPSPSPSPSPLKPGDADGNSKIDIFDYNILLTNFGKIGTNIAGDFDHNNKVDIFDYNTLLSNFGK